MSSFYAETDTSLTLFCDLDQASSSTRDGAISIGNFDGVHRGHAILLGELRQMADRIGGPATVLTFDPHPAAILRPDQAPTPLTWIERRSSLLKDQGVDFVIACRPTMDLLDLSAEQFFSRIVVGQLGVRAMVEGPNFFFGKNRQGNVEALGRLCDDADIALQIVSPHQENGQMVSSTVIRSAIADGNIKSANEMLTSPYRICGTVERGAGRGGPLGFPTANLNEIPVLVPGSGVYGGRTWVNDQSFLAAIHVGPNPTFGEGQCKVEVHLLDFSDDLYGQTLEVQLDFKIRETKKFSSVDALREQLHRDIQTVRKTQ